MIKLLKIPKKLLISYIELVGEIRIRRMQLKQLKAGYMGQRARILIWPTSKIDSKIEYVLKLASRYDSIATRTVPDWEFVVELGTNINFASPEALALCATYAQELELLHEDLLSLKETIKA